MPVYNYKAIDSAGAVTTGTQAAQTVEVLTAMLAARRLFLMEARAEAAPETPAAKAAAPADADPSVRLPLKDVAIFTTQLAVMVRSALPIIESLDLLARQNANARFRAVIADIGLAVRRGLPLSKAFGKYPNAFDEVYISLLSSGEASGKLDVMLERLAAYLEFRIELHQKVRSALVYPTIVISTAVLVVVFLMLFVLPTFMEVFGQFNVELPWPTRILIAVSAEMRRWWYVLVLGAAAVAWYARVWFAKPGNAAMVDKLMLDTPVLGELARNIVMTRILRTLGSLAESGVPIMKALELSKAAAGNAVFAAVLDGVMQNVREGRGLAPAFAESPYVPPSVTGMIGTGEKTGTLPEVVGKVSAYYEAETDAAIRNLFTAIEPLFIIVLALLVGGIALSVLLPMFDLAKGIS